MVAYSEGNVNSSQTCRSLMEAGGDGFCWCCEGGGGGRGGSGGLVGSVVLWCCVELCS